MLLGGQARAQSFQQASEPGLVMTNSFWSDWYVQFGMDMSLQNPYGYNFSNVFPNGKTFGLDLAVGKWFTPQIGIRTKINWENGIPLFENHHANWIAPFYEPGVNMDKGGYLATYWDLQFNLTNFISLYNEERKWNFIVYPRAGIVYNFGVADGKGAPLLGGGILNTYRLNSRWSLYLDLAYHMAASGFVGKEADADTGTGSNSNGYFSVGLGAQVNLGTSHTNEHSVSTNAFSHNWFAQVGVDMSLMNPYGCNFSNVFPKGKTFGLNIAAGKWFTPEFALRARVNWENGLIENNHLEWVPPVDHPEKNHDAGGFIVAGIDAMLNVHNAVAGYDEDRKWHMSPFLRMALIKHLEINSGSPLLGVGIENTYRLNDRLSLFADIGYQVTTSESSAGSTGMGVGEGSNGFFDIDLGIVVDLGKRTFSK